MYNGLATNKDVEFFRKIIEQNKWKEAGPHTHWDSDDIPLKWGATLSNISQVITPDSLVVDCGCGMAPLPMIVAPWCRKLFGVDVYHRPPWKIHNFELFLYDGIKFLNEGPENTLDIIYDSCSVIHFDSNSGIGIPNLGFYNFLRAAERSLKVGGWCLIICDCWEESDHGEFFSPKLMLKMINETKLSLMGPIDLNRNSDTHIWRAGYNIVSFALQKKV